MKGEKMWEKFDVVVDRYGIETFDRMRVPEG